MAMLRESGFFTKDKITVNGMRVRPLDLTAKLLFPRWKLNRDDRDITVLKLIIEGKKAGMKLRYLYELLDRYDPTTRTHSMARTTGFTATVALRMIARGLYRRKGISAPEFIGRQPECVRFMRDGLKDRGIVYKQTVETIEDRSGCSGR